MNCLVLGSSGQIGSALCKYLEREGHNVTEFDIENGEHEDLRIPGALDGLLQDIDFVFFLAFDVGGSTYLKTYQHTYEFIDNNALLMVNTFFALKKYNKPFIFASSQMSNMAFSSYGILKSLGEFYTKTLGGLVVKFWNVYGIEHDPRKTHVITDFVQSALTKGEIKMRTDGQEERQFLFADDCCRALLTLAINYNTIGRDKPLHISSFSWLKIFDIAKIIATMCGNVPVIPGVDKDTVQQGLRNEPDPFILEWWSPTTSIQSGIAEIVNYYKTNGSN